jgi:hypothetical protein
MSDYLSRTAERAEPAAAPAVRPRLASRFESAADPAPAAVSTESEVHPGVPASRPRESAEPPAPLPVQPVQGAVFPATPLPVRTASPPPISPAPPAAQGGVLHPAIARGQDPAPDRDDLPGETPSRATALPPAPLLVERIILREASPTAAHDTPKATPVPAVAAPGAVEETGLPLPHAGPSPQAPRAEKEMAGTQPARSISSTRPPPLLELARPALPPLIPPPAAAQPAPPSVNITIGRLEIRAATPATERTRAKPQTAGHGPLPLDEFLRGKSPRRRGRA